MTVMRMWEAAVLPGRLDDVLGWLTRTVVPDALEAGASTAETLRVVGEERAVLVTRWPAPTRWTEPAPPEPLWSRAHSCDFEPTT